MSNQKTFRNTILFAAVAAMLVVSTNADAQIFRNRSGRVLPSVGQRIGMNTRVYSAPMYRPAQQYRPMVAQPVQRVQNGVQMIRPQVVRPQMQFVSPMMVQQHGFAGGSVMPMNVDGSTIIGSPVEGSVYPTYGSDQMIEGSILEPAMDPNGGSVIMQDEVYSAPVEGQYNEGQYDEGQIIEGQNIEGQNNEGQYVDPNGSTNTSWTPAEGYDNNDTVISVIEPTNDGMVRFRYPSTATSTLAFSINGEQSFLQPGQNVAIPSGQNYQFSFVPSEGAEPVSAEVAAQGDFVFTESEAGWNLQPYTAPMPAAVQPPVDNSVQAPINNFNAPIDNSIEAPVENSIQQPVDNSTEIQAFEAPSEIAPVDGATDGN